MIIYVHVRALFIFNNDYLLSVPLNFPYRDYGLYFYSVLQPRSLSRYLTLLCVSSPWLLLFQCAPAATHRLDRLTSGLLILARCVGVGLREMLGEYELSVYLIGTSLLLRRLRLKLEIGRLSRNMFVG